MNWRGWLAFGGIGSAVASACLGDWARAGMIAAAGLLPAFAWACGELAATRARLRENPLPAAGRHRKRALWEAIASALRAAARVPRRVLTVVGLY